MPRVADLTALFAIFLWLALISLSLVCFLGTGAFVVGILVAVVVGIYRLVAIALGARNVEPLSALCEEAEIGTTLWTLVGTAVLGYVWYWIGKDMFGWW